MPRTARNIFDGGIYHIFNRGHNKYKIFHDQQDYLTFKKLIKKYLMSSKIEIYHYALMPNHFHLLLKVLEAKGLSKFMQGLCQTYAQNYHKRYDTVGYLFQNRYKDIFIKNDNQLLECGRYIERNPLRARLVNNLDNYPYSSYHYYSKGKKDNLITENPLYQAIGKAKSKRQKAYVEYINTSRPYEEILDEKL
ncbi:MAG: transposase [Candidatus Omnitrophota bacterium]